MAKDSCEASRVEKAAESSWLKLVARGAAALLGPICLYMATLMHDIQKDISDHTAAIASIAATLSGAKDSVKAVDKRVDDTKSDLANFENSVNGRFDAMASEGRTR